MFYRRVCYPIPSLLSPFPACSIFEDSPSSLKKTPKARRLCCPQAGYPNTDPMQAEATYILHAPSVEKKQPLFAGTKENGFNNARYADFLRYCVNYAEIN